MPPKKYFHLTPADLRAHPIWVLKMDLITFSDDEEEEDEDDDTGLVVPLPANDPALAARFFSDAIYYARATFSTPAGRSFVGLFKGNTGRQVPGGLHAAIATEAGQVGFYSGVAKPSPDSLAAHYARLGLPPDQLFPLTFRPDAPIPDAPPPVQLLGFYYLDTTISRNDPQYVR